MVWASGGTLMLGHLTAASETETASDTGMCWGPGLLLALPTQCWDVSLTERLAGSVVACLDEQGRTGHTIWVVHVKSSFLPLHLPNLSKLRRRNCGIELTSPCGAVCPRSCVCLRSFAGV